MTKAIAACNELSAGWADAMWAVLWQSTLWALVVASVLCAFRRLSPSLRCWAWRIVAIKMLVLPFWTVNLAVPELPAVSPIDIAPVRQQSAQEMLLPINSTSISAAGGDVRDQQIATPPAVSVNLFQAKPIWQTWLAAVWLVVISIQLGRLIWQRQRLRAVLATTQPADVAIRRLVPESCQRIQIARVPETRVTQLEVSPFVCRLNPPILVLPRSITESSSTFQLRQIVLHELAHLQRRDLAWCWVTYAARMVYWFNPVAHWVASREALERELACDELAMSYSGATAADYAQTLVEAVSRVSRPTVLRAAMAAHLDGSEA